MPPWLLFFTPFIAVVVPWVGLPMMAYGLWKIVGGPEGIADRIMGRIEDLDRWAERRADRL